eukprot:NODE_19040_length_863_cov_2.690217.p2 GENE.NODE_19040_length_863_cov_2.690217~~NODE_19040_length_863_cov_2.690217.p2  ORF type:complete len:168 (+),score=73.11 NODE_19040_length_863_cov_2.690217:36-539(+)
MQDFDGKWKVTAGHVQTTKQDPAAPAPPPPGFDEYQKNEGGQNVIGMIEEIIRETKALESDSIHAEEEEQQAYEDFVKETNTGLETRRKDVTNKSKVKAQKEVDLAQKNKEKDETELDLEHLGNYNAQLHTSCDYVLKNFDLRQTARDEEVQALRQAKDILSGANFQ